jgi:dihydrodipicolinate reductase
MPPANPASAFSGGSATIASVMRMFFAIRVLQRRARDHRRIDDSGLDHALDAVSANALVDYTNAAVVKGTFSQRSSGGSGSSSARAACRLRITRRSSRRHVIAAGNFSLTAALLLRFAAEAACHLEGGR